MITADFLTTILIFGIVFWEHANCAAPASREIRADFVDLVGNHWEPELNPKISPSLMTSSQIPRDKSQITVTFFPPEYCQTARICFDKNRTAFCREQEITWNLATSQITVFLAGKPVDNKKTTWFSDDLTLSNIENPKKTHKFEYWEAQPYFNKRTWDKSKKKSGQMKNDIKGAWITVLTNSRQCQPYIFVDGVVQNQYYFGESIDFLNFS
ncbi:unnamed protein product [Caenorhabditis angaria]|uniref:Galectin n=1 Tax=Caenorhabditis angaria TaxID=860376 RepID=A0A9P1ITP4_9PELO|nr:unnamed protein product [Caenorhabditis angaria]